MHDGVQAAQAIVAWRSPPVTSRMSGARNDKGPDRPIARPCCAGCRDPVLGRINFRLVALEIALVLEACQPRLLLAGEGFADVLAQLQLPDAMARPCYANCPIVRAASRIGGRFSCRVFSVQLILH